MKETWRDIKGYEGKYKVSNLGNVKSFKKEVKGRLLSMPQKDNGYLVTTLFKGGRGTGKQFTIHRLVAEAFLDEKEGCNIVNHLDGNKTNNDVRNLEWTTYKGNYKHAYEMKLRIDPKGEGNCNSILNEQIVRMIRNWNETNPAYFTDEKLARCFGVKRNTINSIRNRVNWKHII